MEMRKAQDYIDEVKAEISQAKSNLETAKQKAEKSQNKNVIDEAITALNDACDMLYEYRD